MIEERAALQKDLSLSLDCASEWGHLLSSLNLNPSPACLRFKIWLHSLLLVRPWTHHLPSSV